MGWNSASESCAEEGGCLRAATLQNIPRSWMRRD